MSLWGFITCFASLKFLAHIKIRKIDFFYHGRIFINTRIILRYRWMKFPSCKTKFHTFLHENVMCWINIYKYGRILISKVEVYFTSARDVLALVIRTTLLVQYHKNRQLWKQSWTVDNTENLWLWWLTPCCLA